MTDRALTHRIREVLVVHDATCGACSGIARELAEMLGVPALLRSCRDPELAARGLPAAALACRVPAVGVVRADGTVRWRLGLRAAPALLALTAPRALHRAPVLLGKTLLTRVATTRRTPRAGAVDHG